MKVVLDTNVLVSGVMRRSTPPAALIDLVHQDRITLVVDDRILAEYREVLHRPALARWIAPAPRDFILDKILCDSLSVGAVASFGDLPDPNDAPFLEVAHAARAPLVTGNLKHFPARLRRGVRVIPPADFLKEMRR